MSDGSAIEWLAWPGTKPATWNPVVGCTRVNEGCRNCYAERMAKRLAAMGQKQYQGVLDGHGRWNGLVKLVPEALEKPLRWREPRTVFVDSMSDLFHPAVPFEYLDRVFAVMALCQQHRFIVLTKRGERMAEYVNEGNIPGITHSQIRPGEHDSRAEDRYPIVDRIYSIAEHAKMAPWKLRNMWPLPNVILGVSVVDQPSADEQIPHLLRTPAACRAVSYEPALGPVDFGKWVENVRSTHMGMSVRGAIRNRAFDGLADKKTGRELSRGEAEAALLELLSQGVEMLPLGDCPDFNTKTGCPGHPQPRIDWLIVGGESGPNARPMHPDWARSARDQCVSAGVHFFFKQWGEWEIMSDANGHGGVGMPDTGEKYTWLGYDGKTQNPSSHGLGDKTYAMARVGKKAAGAVLDGREWREFPTRTEVAP